jgi:hypothetical protein
MNSPNGSGSDVGSIAADKVTASSVTTQQSAVREITCLHDDIIQTARTTLDKAIRIGELLVGVRAGLNHGEWLPWIKSNLPFSDRTVRNYIRCFEEREHLKSETISNLTDAYKLLEEPTNTLSPTERLELERLEAIINESIEMMDSALSLLHKTDSPDPWLDTPIDEQAYLVLPVDTSEKPSDSDEIIHGAIFCAVISHRFRAGGSITRREILALQGLCDAARQEACARKKE